MTETTHFDRAFLFKALEEYQQERADAVGGAGMGGGL